MSFTFIASAEAEVDTAGTTLAASSSLNVATGDLLVAWCKHESTNGTFAVSDGGSNTFTFDAGDEINHSNADLDGSFGYRLSGVANATATFTLTTASKPYRRILVWQFRPDSGDTVARVAGATGQGTSTTPTSGTISPSGTDLVVLGGYGEYSVGAVTGEVINGVAADAVQDVGISRTCSWYRLLTSGFSSGTAACVIPSAAWICTIIAFSATLAVPPPIPMPKKFADRVKETTTTTGAGNITLAGAVTQFETFTSNYALGEPFYYAVVGQTGSEWEVGIGSLSGTTTLVRDRILASSNSDAAVTLSAGTKDVFVTYPSYRANATRTRGQVDAAIAGLNMS